MNIGAGYTDRSQKRIVALWDEICRAFAEFLTIPTVVILAFLLLAAGSYTLDHIEAVGFARIRELLKTRVFADSKATSDLLGTIASSIITVTSIIISLLLVALQQSAGTLTHQVFDQFLRRHVNQFYFGFFVGLALFALVTLATVTESFNPVLGGTLAFLLTIIALYILILLLYTTINQMRPAVIIDAIHSHTLAARQRLLPLLRRTRRSPGSDGVICVRVKTRQHGFVTRIDIDDLGMIVKGVGKEVEVILLVSIGAYVAFEDVIAEIKAATEDETELVVKGVQSAIHFENQRDISADPAYGIEQLEMIAWTSISTAKSDPAPGLLIIRNLRDVLAHWSAATKEPRKEEPFPIVYRDDSFTRLMDVFESLAVVASESMQHQTFAEVLHTFAVMFDRLSLDLQRRTEDSILRVLSALGEHVLTTELNEALSDLVRALDGAGRTHTASAVRQAQGRLSLSVGKLHSRSTRTKAGLGVDEGD